MFKKRIASLLLAGVMTASLAVPALATTTGTEAEATTPKNTVVVNGGYEEIPIAVSVPTEPGKAIINPYGLPYEGGKLKTAYNGGAADDKVEIVGEQITTVPLAIKNEGNVDLDVGASVTTTVEGNLKLQAFSVHATSAENATAPVTPLTSNSAYVYLEAAVSTAAGKADEKGDEIADAILLDSADEGGTLWGKGEKVVLASGKTVASVAGKPLVTLKKVVTDAENDAGLEYAAGSIAVFRLAGDCVATPKTPWAVTDKFTATIAFTFTPAADNSAGGPGGG